MFWTLCELKKIRSRVYIAWIYAYTHIFFLIFIYGRVSIVFGLNFWNSDFDGITRFVDHWIQKLRF